MSNDTSENSRGHGISHRLTNKTGMHPEGLFAPVLQIGGLPVVHRKEQGLPKAAGRV